MQGLNAGCLFTRRRLDYKRYNSLSHSSIRNLEAKGIALVICLKRQYDELLVVCFDYCVELFVHDFQVSFCIDTAVEGKMVIKDIQLKFCG